MVCCGARRRAGDCWKLADSRATLHCRRRFVREFDLDWRPEDAKRKAVGLLHVPYRKRSQSPKFMSTLHPPLCYDNSFIHWTTTSNILYRSDADK